MSCPAKDDPNRENKSWVWSAVRCPGVTPDIDDCPTGFNESVGPKEDGPRPTGCGALGSGNRIKCYRNQNTWSTSDKVKCCTGDIIAYDCPTDFCAQNVTNCTNVLSEYCRIGNNINTEACTRVLKSQNEALYDEILKKYCKGENLNSQVCKSYCSANVNTCRDELKTFCKDKVGQANYAKICACFYPDKVYSDMSKKLASEWNFPSELGDPKAQCIYDACKQADIVPTETCNPISIASCLQNVVVDTAGNTNIGNVYIKQDSDCKSTFRKIGDPSDPSDPRGPSGPLGPLGPSGPSDPSGPSGPSGMSTITIAMIVFAIVAVLIISIVIIMNIK